MPNQSEPFEPLAAKCLLIINPTSGNETAAAHIPRLQQRLSRFFGDVDVRLTEKGGDAEAFAREACREAVDAIFAVGGDGTINEVLAGMAEAETKPKLGIFPGGTFNAMARLLRIPLDLDAAIENFDPERFLPIDIGRVNDRYFGYILSIGDIPEAIHQVSSEEKSRAGVFAYIKTIAGRLGKLQNHRLQIAADGEAIHEEASHLLLLLTDHIGPMKIIGQGAAESDGRMNLLIMKGKELSKLLAIIPDFFGGHIEENEAIDFRRVETVRVRSSSDLHCDIDGEAGPFLPLEIKVLPRHIIAYYGSDELLEAVDVFPDETDK